jgi:alpha-tubulin suppressor-like RCC1 family protein
VKCWGLNSDGQLGNGAFVDSVAAVTVSGLTDVEDISLYARFACAQTGGGLVKCWGDNAYTQLGNGGSADSSLPVNVVLGEVAKLGMGFMHGCVLHTDKAVSCWGLNSYNQLGIFDTRVPWEVAGQ